MLWGQLQLRLLLFDGWLVPTEVEHVFHFFVWPFIYCFFSNHLVVFFVPQFNFLLYYARSISPLCRIRIGFFQFFLRLFFVGLINI